jgi:enoyl-CoA hydratase/carnithine racemase
MDSPITQVLEENTAVWTLNHPPVNALSQNLLSALKARVEEICQNDKIRAVVITSFTQKYFVAGADIKELNQISSKVEGKKYAEQGQAVFQKIESASKPFIAAVEGYCLGGGLELALACHFRIAGTEARLGLPEVNLGLMPGFGGTQRLARQVGRDRALELMLTGKHISAQEAYDLGLVSQVVKGGSSLDSALSLARQIQTKSPLSIASILSSVRWREEDSLKERCKKDAQAFGALFETEDSKEGLTAFLEKRLPHFKGR